MIDIREFINHPIQLTDVELIKCNLKKNFDADGRDKFDVRLKSWGGLDSNEKNVGYTYLNIIIGFEEDESPYNIDITYRGKCLLDKNIDEDKKFENFLETQGVKLLWPYIRVAVSDFMIKMNIDPIKLPTLDVLKTMEKSKRVDGE